MRAQTRSWNEGAGRTELLRDKEEAEDYRYFPEPDLPPLVLAEKWLAAERQALPELPAAKRERFAKQYALPAADAAVLSASRELADYYERVVKAGVAPRDAANWVMNDLLALSPDGENLAPTPERLAEVIGFVSGGKVSRQAAKRVLAEMVSAPKDAALAVAERLGLLQVSDTGAIDGWVRETLEAHPAEVSRYKSGEAKLMGFLVGQVMKRSKGKADPKAVSAALAAALAK